MSSLQELKSLTNSLCLRDKNLRLSQHLLDILLESSNESISFAIINSKRVTHDFGGDLFKRSLCKKNISFDSILEENNLDDKKYLDAVKTALANKNYSFEEDSFRIFSKPVLSHSTDEVVGAVIVIFKNKTGV